MATSKIADAVESTTGQPTTDAAIFNGVLGKMHDPNALPVYRVGDNFIPYGQTFLANSDVFNDYLSTLAQQYGLIFVKQAEAQNPLNNFRRGQMPMGGKIESVVFDTIQPKLFRSDLTDGDDNPFTQHFGRVNGATYVETHDVSSKNTILDTQDTMFFQNLTQFNDFVYGKIMQLVNGIWLDEYYHVKLTLMKSLADGMMAKNDPPVTSTKDLQREILRWSRRLQYFRDDSNALGYNQATRVDDIYVILPLDQSIDLDVDYFANVYNAETSRNKNIKTLEVDQWPDVYEYSKDHVVVQADIDSGSVDPRRFKVGSTIPAGTLAGAAADDTVQKVDGSKVGAVILDRDALQLWDALPLTLSAIANPEKRYTNIFANKKTYMMFVQALNSRAIMMA